MTTKSKKIRLINIVYLNLYKEFHKVPHKILNLKLYEYNNNVKYIEWIADTI